MRSRRRMSISSTRLGGLLGLIAAAGVGSAATHDNITGLWLLLYPVGFSGGVAIARTFSSRSTKSTSNPRA
jgi:hypothetical protein